jgi:hypothetical protein
MLHFDHGYITCLYVLFYLVGDACAQIVAILLVYSALCIFEKHILAFVDLIHALPTRGRKVPNSFFQGEFCIEGRKIGRNAFVQGELAFKNLGALFRLNFSCALLSMVSSPFAWRFGGCFWTVHRSHADSLPRPCGRSARCPQTVRPGLADGPPSACGQSAWSCAELLSPLLFEFRFCFGIIWGLLLGLLGP